VGLRKGFTLIELLVVISLIALLIAILLPALTAAREAGRALQCASNIRSVGLGMQVYVEDSKGWYPQLLTTPPGGWITGSDPNVNGYLWAWNLARRNYILIAGDPDPMKPQNGGVYRCPSRVYNYLDDVNHRPHFTAAPFGPLCPDNAAFFARWGSGPAGDYRQVRSAKESEIRSPSAVNVLAETGTSPLTSSGPVWFHYQLNIFASPIGVHTKNDHMLYADNHVELMSSEFLVSRLNFDIWPFNCDLIGP
jgi:prepilin-type N-terminal cleavage/methylation domain-containing protein